MDYTDPFFFVGSAKFSRGLYVFLKFVEMVKK